MSISHRFVTQWKFIILIAICVWLLFVFIGPGHDFFGAYTKMVLEPERLSSVSDYPWTLNPPWLVPFMAPFVTLPGRAGYYLFMAVTIVMIIFGAYIFGGKTIPILLSAHMLWILWWGQLEGWGVLGLGIAWIALRRKSWPLMFLALVISAFKPQIGFIPVLALWWWSGNNRWKSLAILSILFGISIWIWGPWPVWYLQGITKYLGDNHQGPWNASLGLIALPLFLPALLFPLNREKRLIALTATTYIISPHMPYYSTILLLCFAVPWWAYLFGFLGFFPTIIGTTLAWNGIVFLPISVLLWIYIPIINNWRKQRGIFINLQF